MSNLLSLARRHVAAGTVDMTVRQVAVLAVIAERHPAALHLRTIADELKLSKPVVTRAVTALISRDLVARQRSAEDGRDVQITLTTWGAHFCSQIVGEGAQ